MFGIERSEVLWHEYGVLLQGGVFLHDGLVLTRAAVFDDTTATSAGSIEEADHLLQVLFAVHTHSVTTLRYVGSLRLDASSLEHFEELLTLAAGHYIVLLTVENDDGRVVLVHIGGGAQTKVFVGLGGKFGIEQHVLRTVVAHSHVFTTIHCREIDGTRPVASRINGTALVGVLSQSAFEVDVHRAHLGLLGTAGGGSDGSQMTAGRETAGSDERGVELVLLGLASDEANDGTNVMNLCRPLGVHAGTVVGANYSVTCIEQSLDDGAQVGCALTVVAEPCASVDVDDYGIGGLLLLRQIDIAGVIGLTVAYIVDVFPLLACLQCNLRHLETAESSLRLSHTCQRQEGQNKEQCFSHFFNGIYGFISSFKSQSYKKI